MLGIIFNIIFTALLLFFSYFIIMTKSSKVTNFDKIIACFIILFQVIFLINFYVLKNNSISSILEIVRAAIFLGILLKKAMELSKFRNSN